jgi:murein DD-endopeptidase MepM/ murein hydrolase activator NlpD
MLDERRQAIQEIENQISLLNLAPSIFSTKFEPTVPFNEQKGRLLPPLSRTVVSIPFGKNRHPKLGTVTINPGVDLKAVPGEAVFASAYGQVTRITYLRGFGNTVILDHSDGFYTVYSRLGSIIVQEGQVMEQGQTMGVVGNTGVEGDFHFEIWSSRKKQSPLKWLKRN